MELAKSEREETGDLGFKPGQSGFLICPTACYTMDKRDYEIIRWKEIMGKKYLDTEMTFDLLV